MRIHSPTDNMLTYLQSFFYVSVCFVHKCRETIVLKYNNGYVLYDLYKKKLSSFYCYFQRWILYTFFISFTALILFWNIL